KGTGKTAIFRKLAVETDAIVVTSPPGTDTHRPWTPDANFYSSLAVEIERRQLEWRQAWPVIIGLAILQHLPEVPSPRWLATPVSNRDNQYSQFTNLSFKIMLREDIWREVSIPNKSHLDARSARLAWANQTDYLRIAIKQAWRSEP